MKSVFAVTVTAITLLAATAATARADTVVIDRARARGDYAVAQASGSINHPKRIWVKVKSRPRQRTDGAWSMTCTKNSGAGSRSGRHSGTTPYRQRLRMTYPQPDSCSVAANAQLSGSGRIIVILLARV